MQSNIIRTTSIKVARLFLVQRRQHFHFTESLARQSRYLTFKTLEELAADLKLKYKLHPVWPGWRRKTAEIRGTLFGRRIAQFPVVVFEK